jgi:hypothetical protein
VNKLVGKTENARSRVYLTKFVSVHLHPIRNTGDIHGGIRRAWPMKLGVNEREGGKSDKAEEGKGANESIRRYKRVVSEKGFGLQREKGGTRLVQSKEKENQKEQDGEGKGMYVQVYPSVSVRWEVRREQERWRILCRR